MHAIDLEPCVPGEIAADLDLIKRLQRKDLLAYRELIERYYSFVYMMALTLHRDETVADQYVLELFTHAWNHASGMTARGSLRSYFFKLIYAKYQRYVSMLPTIKEMV
ncbi:RNA polymerase sigma factor [Dinghuibacter silviterrae]|uniref:Uncharacterized protein n=1 Tax=Dinghuibacter silviterrae TaxID=1539049 RepID=A0A4R8DMZ7_9BACT|nr:hypothetical protein [Dinghuibacter silviterrae]TDW99381.1 hypothetical protein EDB95_0391 [Dinghuibacter silviterrae]